MTRTVADVDQAALEALLKGAGKQKQDLAAHLGIAASAVSDIFQGRRQVKIAEAPRLAAFLKISRDDLFRLLGVELPKNEQRLIVAGTVSEDIIVLESLKSDAPLEEVESPIPGYEGIVVRIRGNSMFPRYRAGDLIAFRLNGVAPADLIGRDAIVELDGILLLKIIQPGSEPNRYVLLSVNPAIPPIVNVELRAVAAIDWHKP
jgi:transcriptional regulator with XRE-family HTH domain